MPPRIPILQCLNSPTGKFTPGPWTRRRSDHPYTVARAGTNHSPSYLRPFASSPSTRASTVSQRRRHRDPWAIAQAKARKTANLSRQEVLRKERASVAGDPVRGITSPYVKSFDSAAAPNASPAVLPNHPESDPAADAQPTATPTDEQLNYFLSQTELDAGIKYSQWLSRPPTKSAPESLRDLTDDRTAAEREAAIKDQQATAAEALTRIANLSLGSSKDRLRLNITRCINDFGRHNTDDTLPPPLKSAGSSEGELPKTPRVGPDTGSSEVQIAILTAKIRALADFLETRGNMDKVNKRNLRLLVHRRAKLLKYLRRKERGGPRFQNLVDTLGLSEATWKGEITIMGPLGGHSAVRLARLQKSAA